MFSNPWRRARPAPPARDAVPEAIPDGLIVYAVGDIHGEIVLLRAMLSAIAADFSRHGAGCAAEIVFIGDYVDRGPDSRGVIDCLLAHRPAGFRQRWLRGNHEALMLAFLRDPVQAAAWLDRGGLATLRSYGIAPVAARSPAERALRLGDQLSARLPPAHLAFLTGLEYCAIRGDYAFVHAGIRPGRSLADQSPDDLLWIRVPFLRCDRRHEKTIVHGHTMVDDIAIVRGRRGGRVRIAIDTGAHASGRLSAIALQGTELRTLQVTRPPRGQSGVAPPPPATVPAVA